MAKRKKRDKPKAKRRCHAIIEKTGEQCKLPPLKGQDACQYHGGALPERVFLLGKAGGYVGESTQALTQQDPIPTDRTEANQTLGPAPEPEAVDPKEVSTYTRSIQAQMAHRAQKEREEKERQERIDEERKVRDTLKKGLHGLPHQVQLAAIAQLQSSITQIAAQAREGALH